MVCLVPPRHEGRFAIVTKREAGLRWTRTCRKTNGRFADGEVVWSRRPDAGAKLAMMLASCGRRGQESPVPEESTKEPVKTIRAGDAGLPPLNLYARVRFP